MKRAVILFGTSASEAAGLTATSIAVPVGGALIGGGAIASVVAPYAAMFAFSGGVGEPLRALIDGDNQAAIGTANLLGVVARLQAWDGADFDRLRAVADNADAQAAATLGALLAMARLQGWNGATFDRLRAGGNNADAQAAIALGALETLARGYVFDADLGTWSRIRAAASLDTGLEVGWLGAHSTLAAITAGGLFQSVNELAVASARQVSALNAANVVNLELRNVHDTLAIHSAASAGTSTLDVEASADQVNFLTIDALAAAAVQVKQYTATTVGATTALSPLAFRFIRITAGAAGAGNTTTLTVTGK